MSNETTHKVETADSLVTCCKMQVIPGLPKVMDWYHVTCSECLKHRPASHEWMSEQLAFRDADLDET